LLGSALPADVDVAVWDVSAGSPAWVPAIGEKVTRVDLHYVPWDRRERSFWCPRITIRCGGRAVEVVMGDADDGALIPSADNLAVRHAGSPLPAWLGPVGRPR